MYAVRLCEVIICENFFELFYGRTLVALALNTSFLSSPEEFKHLLMVPQHADVIVGLLGSVDGALDRIAIVVDHEDDWLEAVSDIRATASTVSMENVGVTLRVSGI